MRNKSLNKDSISLPQGTKTKQPGGSVWISKPGRIFGSRNGLFRKDKVMHGHTREVLRHRGGGEAVEAPSSSLEETNVCASGESKGKVPEHQRGSQKISRKIQQ